MEGWCELVAIEDGHISMGCQLKGCVGHRRWHISVKTGHISMKLPRVCMGCLSSFERVIVLVAG